MFQDILLVLSSGFKNDWAIKVEIMELLWKHSVFLTVIIFGAGIKKIVIDSNES